MKYIYILTLSISVLGSSAFAGVFLDSETGAKVKYQGDVDPMILELVAKKVGQAKWSAFRRAEIIRVSNLAPNVFLVRTGIYSLLVQTDLGRVDEVGGEILKVWGDVIVEKRGKDIVTFDRTNLSVIDTIKFPAQGEGEATWTVQPMAGYLLMRMNWEPSVGHAVGFLGCMALFAVANPVNLFPPYPDFDWTSRGAFHYVVGPDGKINNSRLLDSIFTTRGALDSILSIFR